MSLNSYANFQAAIADQLARSDLGSQIADCTTLFESEAAYELFRQRGAETRTILVPSNPPVLTVSASFALAGYGGLIYLTIAQGTSSLTTGEVVNVTNMTNMTGADGSWVITVVDGGDILLQNSVWTNTTTSFLEAGSLQTDAGFCTLPTDYMGWRRLTWTGSPTFDLEYCQPSVWSSEFPTWMPTEATDTPRVFTIEANIVKIRPFDPTPLEFIYWAKTPALIGNLNWLFTNRPDCYWYGVLEQVMVYTKDEQRAQEYNQKKQNIYDNIKLQRFREGNNLRVRLDRSSYGATP